MGIFSKIHAYVLIKTRREFIHLRRLLMKRRRLLEILEIGLTMPKFTSQILLLFSKVLHILENLLLKNFTGLKVVS